MAEGEERMPFASECPEGKNCRDVGTPKILEQVQGTENKCFHSAWQVENKTVKKLDGLLEVIQEVQVSAERRLSS